MVTLRGRNVMAQGLVEDSCSPHGHQEAEGGSAWGQGHVFPGCAPMNHSVQPGPVYSL